MLSFDVRPDCARAKREAESKGTGYFVNVGNDFQLNRSLGDDQLFEFEQIGINESSADKIFERATEVAMKDNDGALAIHAPYSVSPRLMKMLKSFNSKRGRVTSLHLAETADEVEFVATGRGRMVDLLNYRVPKWEFHPAGVSPVEYVHSLGLLDEKTLCVHCVFVDDEDARIISESGSAVAVCLRSNLELSGELPPVDKFLKAGIRLLIGTDSTASAPDLDMFAEVGAFYSKFRNIMSPISVLSAATSDAAIFLGIENRYGSLSPGASSKVVYLPFDGKKEEVLEYLVSNPENKMTVGES